MTLHPALASPQALVPVLAATVSRHRTLLGLDFDGTLAPLVDDPTRAQMSDTAAAALRDLSASPAAVTGRLVLALVSGRDLETLHAIASPPPGTHLIASHGAERGYVGVEGELTSQQSLSMSDDDAVRLADLSAAVSQIVDAHPGTMLEPKPLAAVLHTRLATPEVTESAQQAALILAHEFRVPVLRGHDVIEMPILHATKGKAVAELKSELDLDAVVFAGDDVTDETVLETLEPEHGDIGIKVGQAVTSAEHRLADTDAIGQLLAALATTLCA